MIFSKR